MSFPSINRKQRLATFIYKIKAYEAVAVKPRTSPVYSLCRNELNFLGRGMTKEQVLNARDKRVRYKICSSTFVSYLSHYRNAILALNFLHPTARKNINLVRRRFPEVDLSALDAELPLLREAMADLLALTRDSNQELYAALLKIRIEHPAFYLMRPDRDVLSRIKSSYKSVLDAKLEAVMVVQLAHVRQLIASLPLSTHWVDLAMYLALVSGRRAIEVLAVGRLSMTRRVGYLSFFGQAKAKSRGVVPAFDIPVLDSPVLILKVQARLRILLSRLSFFDKPWCQLSNDEVNGAVAGRLNRAVKSLLGKDFVFKDLRRIYIKMCVREFYDESVALPKFYAQILGHSPEDNFTQVSYDGLRVVADENCEPLTIVFSSDTHKHDRSGQLSLVELSSFDKAVEMSRSKALARIHAFVKKAIEKNPDVFISQTFIAKPKSAGGAGASRPVIKRYLSLVGIGHGKEHIAD